MKKILIVTSSFDVTVNYFINKFKDRASFFRFNIDKLENYQINVINGAIEISYKNNLVNFNELDAIYYRKPMMPNLSEYGSDFHQLMRKDIETLLFGLVESFEGKCLSKPITLKKAENKVYQAYLAKKIGFNIPNFLITNNEKIGNDFIKREISIIKPLSLGKYYTQNSVGIIHTNLIDCSKKIENINLSPIYLQKYIEKDYEIRVTVVNENFFPVKIECKDSIDWRKMDDQVVNYSLIEISEELKEKCLELMKILDIKFGAFDFLVKESNTYFLEVNPNGQWLWLEEKFNLEISESIFRYLIEG